MTSSERPGCATPIREAGEVTTEARLLALPTEPPVEATVEARAADGYRECTWRREPPRGAQGDWPWVLTTARGMPGFSWRQVCEYAIRYGCELWLTREGLAEEAPRG